MIRAKIKCHKPGARYDKPHFFILNKGRNSGKPLYKECVNCFIFLAECEEERLHYFNLCFVLWQGKHFHMLLIGSVIEFIRIGNFSTTLFNANIAFHKTKDSNILLKNIHELNLYQENLHKQIQLITGLKRTIIYKLFNEAGKNKELR